MWLGTFGGGLNLAVKTADGYEFKHFLQDNYGEKRIRVIEEDKNGRMWVGTNNGVYIFHPDSLIASPKNYVIYNHANGTFPSNEIRCLMNDDKGNMWIGTAGAGFAVCRPEGNYQHLTFDCYDIKDGLSNAVVQSIVQDKDNKMWIATEYGISRFTPATRQIENHFFSSYTLGNVYSENTACVSNDGNLLFGTNYGLVVLDANKIENLDKPASVIFTGLQINGAHMLPGVEDSPLQEAMPYINGLNLKYYQNSFIISFSTFNYLDGVSKYSYSLPPYDTEWSSPSSLNFAGYRNLPPGKYELHVKACNAAGIWGEENIMEIVIAPLLEDRLGVSDLCDSDCHSRLFQFPHYPELQCLAQPYCRREPVDGIQTGILYQHFPRIPHSADTDSGCFRKNRQYGESFQGHAALPEDYGQEHETDAAAYQPVTGIQEDAEKQARPFTGRDGYYRFLL